ncbi:hypothetical protein OPT61_g8728 [Boeremia exigua]|uniref:Uncharacterized protein n=1 Tax=Boeremia exigua TaxID=749465 RepID=A0ACC2HX91_9PLEO|nr:hypothetical protein OPT61_g8728 [Boeremia exigua]
MARGVDDLVNHVLSEIALTGVQGAGSTDFKRFVQTFYSNSQGEDGSKSQLQTRQLGPALYEKVWHWVTGHADVRITHNGVACHYTLPEFEAVETSGTVPTSIADTAQPAENGITVKQPAGPGKTLLALRNSVRQRLSKEGLNPQANPAPTTSSPQGTSPSQDAASEKQGNTNSAQYLGRAARVLPDTSNDVETLFDDPQTSTTAPRLFASQSRIWQALTGHGIDLKKVPTMEFVLLSLIASHGETGVTQPDLTALSGQDKRSVPHRTDELCRKGYIEKRPVQSGKLRTSLCVHKKFVSDDHFLTSGKVEDVFQYKKFVLSGFVHLLYNTLKDAGVVPTRDIRKRLNVPMSTWNKRAVQGALIRLDQTGMVKRFRARRKDAEEDWLTCIEVLREPRPEDHENLKFRRQVAVDEADEEQSDEDVDADTMMRDLEVDMLNADSQEADGGKEDAGRVPPQWVPERILCSMLYEVVQMGGSDGWDAGVLRDRIVGKFWRRPLESYLTRLTDNWEATQPAHIRHLALIRDTRNTQEKKFVHYVYRTYGNFQKAVDAGDVIWAGVSKPVPKQSSTAKGGRPKKTRAEEQLVDAWGFRTLNSGDFLNADGSGSLSECRAAIVHGRKYGPRWDNSLTEDIGYQKDTPKLERGQWKNDVSRSKAKTVQAKLSFTPRSEQRDDASPRPPARQSLIADAATDSEDTTLLTPARVMGLPKRKYESGLLTMEQRIMLGLKPKGRLSKFVEDQVREHRKNTGDPVSIPDSIDLERPVRTPEPAKLGPLMTKEQRIAAGLPPRGRLGQKIEDQIREQRGLPKAAEKVKKPRRNRPANEPALLSKEQRIKLGIIPHGRLPQSLMEGLREEREFDISMEDSKVIPEYLSAVQDKKAKAEITRLIDEVRIKTLHEHDPDRQLNQPNNGTPVPEEDTPVPEEDTPVAEEETPVPEEDTPVLAEDTPVLAEDNGLAETDTSLIPSVIEKRKADDETIKPNSPKRIRVEQDVSTANVDTTIPTPPSTSSADAGEPVDEHVQPDSTTMIEVEDEVEPAATGSPHQTGHKATETVNHEPPMIDLKEVEAKVRLIKETYSNRSAPGLYVDPFAKRRIGQGRPRNAFIATFRLNQLSTLEWFTPKPSVELEHNGTPAARHSITSSVRSDATDPKEHSVADDTEAASPAESMPPAGVIATENAVATTDIVENPPHRSSSVYDAVEVVVDLEQSVPDQTPVEDGATTDPGRTEERTQSSQSDAQPAQQHARPVAGWNAINKPVQSTSTYQSPYAPSESSAATGEAVQDSADDAQIEGVCGPIMEEDIASRSARKLAAYMGTKTGGGSQKMFRHKIIRQIIDLCNGAYPMHGEIGRPFVTLWKQQYPNITPPNSSTVLSNLRDMIADSRNGLKKLSFLIRLRQSAGLKKKDMVVYQHLTPTSPQVTRLAYNMANFSNTKAHQYYPEEIRHLVSDESFYVPMPVAPKDETVTLERLNPSLQHKIKEANLERRRRYYHKQRDEESARDAQNAGVEAPLTRADGQPRAKRARLASLNDKNKRYRRAPSSNATAAPMDAETEAGITEEAEVSNDELVPGRILTWKKPWVGPAVRPEAVSAQTVSRQHSNAVPGNKAAGDCVSSINAPIVRFYPTNGTFSTEFGLVRQTNLSGPPLPARVIARAAANPKGTKRVRIIEPEVQRPSKKVRMDLVGPNLVNDADLVVSSSDESDNSDSSSTSSSSDDDDDIPLMQLSKAKAKAKAKARAQAKAKAKAKAKQRRSEKGPPPTLLERLTGLTGDPEEPVYRAPKPKKSSQKTYQNWSERKKAQINKRHRERKYADSKDPVDKFKKLCCALVIASSMAGGQGRVDWSIVEKVHNSKGFDLEKTKTLWAWMQTNMATQIADLTADFEARFLEAYENDRIAPIEDPSKYDWANLVRWAMHNCVYPELSLPIYREALQQFIVDLSSFEVLDRPKWYREKIADRVRTQIQLQYSYSVPLHQKSALRSAVDETEMKARSWIRANTATPQSVYDSNTAHEKLRLLGDTVLAKVVGEYVDRQMLRMRKLKRLLPGRNFTFTAKLAKRYGRTFELSDFMAAIKIKKDMDVAFAQEDLEKRFYSISRAESDGAIMAIMSLLSEGKVKFAPQVPSVNNEFGAPLPRLSIWGFMEGDYVHRGIDRQRLFWDVHVIPTETYAYGNPLQPETAPPSDAAGNSVLWSPLPRPPLPGKCDSNALLPIWSSMDGQHVTWPWWYRILNLVLQPLIFQPGATVEDIHANCDEYTTEIFEIELALQWLISVNAVKQIIGGGYVTLPGVWAAFGDVLQDMENDWLDGHVKRKHKRHEKQQWREQYHLRYARMQGREPLSYGSDGSDLPTDDEREETASSSADIMRHPKEQYAIVRSQLPAAPELSNTGQSEEQTAQPAAATEPGTIETRSPEANVTSEQDVDMGDADAVGEADTEDEADAMGD